MKLTIQRLATLLLSVVFALAMCAFGSRTYADPAGVSLEPVDDTSVYATTVIFSGVEAGDVLTAYKVVDYDANYNGYVFDESFAAFLAANSDGKATADNAEALTNFFHKVQNDGTLSDLINKFVAACSNGTYVMPQTKVTSTVATNDSDTRVQIKVDEGYYIVLATSATNNSRVYQAQSIFVKANAGKAEVYAGGNASAVAPAKDGSITVNVKSEEGPTIQKRVQRADDNSWRKTKTVSVGDTATFYVKLTIPAYTGVTDLNLVVDDTFDDIKYVDGSAKVYGTLNDDGTFADEITKDSSFPGTVTSGEYDTTSGSQAVKFALDYNSVKAQDTARTVYLAYQATVQPQICSEMDEQARLHATNSATLTFSVSSTGETRTTAGETCDLYSFRFQLNKLDNNGAALKGAEFEIYNTKDGSITPISFVKEEGVSSNGVAIHYYRPALAGENGTTTLSASETLSSMNNNVLIVRGLDSYGPYKIKETKVPEGYYAPHGDFTLTMAPGNLEDNDSEHSGSLKPTTEGTSFKANNDADSALVGDQGASAASFTVNLKNSATFSLPTTGEAGTILITVIGVVLMSLAVFFYARRRKNN